MNIEYDKMKSLRNTKERMLPFSDAIKLDWSTAQIVQDKRYDYPEKRFVATGCIEDRVHSICFTPITQGIRVISFRKANKRKVNRYERQTINR